MSTKRARAARAGAVMALAAVAVAAPLGASAAVLPSAAPAAGPQVEQPEPDKPRQPKPDKPKPEKPEPEKPEKPEPPKDVDAPAAPMLGEPGIDAGGAVSLTVVAEKAAQVVVREAGEVVATALGTGQQQTLEWTTTTGRHRYAVTATDKAGNRSKASRVTVRADADPPAVRGLKLRPGTSADTRSRISFRSEPGAAYRLLVGGTETTGKVGRRPVETVLDLPDGRHPVIVELTDELGNAGSTEARIRVRIPRLDVEAELVSEPTDDVQRFEVEAPPTAVSGTVTVPGTPVQRFSLKRGRGTAEIELEDGSYDGVVVTVTDAQGRKGSADVELVEVDRTAPVLEVDVDQVVADGGRFRASIDTDPGATVTWSLLSVAGTVVDTANFVAEAGPQSVEVDVEEGEYRLEVEATDQYGRPTRVEQSLQVAADPRPGWQTTLLVVGAVVLGLALLAGLALLGRRGQRRLRAAVLARRERRHEARVAAATRDERAAAARVADEDWTTRHAMLSAFLDGAGAAGPTAAVPPVGVELADDEILRHVSDTTTGGHVVMTDHRLLVTGDGGATWPVGEPLQLRHEGEGLTLVRGGGAGEWTPVEYADPATRLHLELFAAEQEGRGAEYLAAVHQELLAHDLRRPRHEGSVAAR